MDQKGNLMGKGWRPAGKGMVYEFSFPLWNEDPSGTAWKKGNAYMIAFLVGPGPAYGGIAEDTWMSDQVVVRVGGPSQDSIYRPAPSSRDPEVPPGGKHQ